MHLVFRRAAVAVLMTVPFAARAQSAPVGGPRRAPLWGTLSVGRGDLQVNCEICRRNDQSSWAADVTVGGWVTARASLGGELGAWRLGGDEATQRVMMVNAISQLYPFAKAPAFVRLGLGLMSYRSTDGEHALSARSLAMQVARPRSRRENTSSCAAIAISHVADYVASIIATGARAHCPQPTDSRRDGAAAAAGGTRRA